MLVLILLEFHLLVMQELGGRQPHPLTQGGTVWWPGGTKLVKVVVTEKSWRGPTL